MPAKLPGLLEQLTHTGDGVCGVDIRQRIILWNQAASSLLGYTSAEVLGKYCYDIIQAKDCEGNILCQRDCSPVEEAKKLCWKSSRLFQARSKSGEVVWVDVTALSILSRQRNLSAFVLIFRRAEPRTVLAAVPTGLEPSSSGGADAGRENRAASPSPLSHREMGVLLLMAEGLNIKAIGARLLISPVTVRNHIQKILKKLGVHTRLEAVLWAIRHGVEQSPGLPLRTAEPEYL